jgi:hypothetical protein
MAASGATVRTLPAKRPAKEARRGSVHTAPEVVINRVEVTITLAPVMFGIPLRLVDWVLERLGLVTKEELASVIDPAFDDEPAVEPVPTDRSQLKVGRPVEAKQQRKAA